MNTLTIERNAVNVAALDATLRTALGNQYAGLSQHNGKVRLHLLDSTSASQVQEARQLAIDHDSAVLTPKQVAQQARQQQLTGLRSEGDNQLDLSAYDGTSADIQALARKIAWLELEIQELRGS